MDGSLQIIQQRSLASAATILGESLFLLLQKSLQNKSFIQKISLQKYFNTQLSEKRRNLKLTQRSLASAAQH